LEKLPVVDKLEAVLLLLLPSQKFNRGAKQVQAIHELIKIRNAQVHTKTVEQEVLVESIDQLIWRFESPGGVSNILSIPDDSAMWDSSHSNQALVALDEFLELYLLKYLQLDPSDYN
ncbi:MAG: hypothetical protein MN733_39505, partial [Nitrososphaera sp.]|nr:hypothetical protein [Nitrososphaera sp.]